MDKRIKHTQRGFTLIEILIVIGIMAILAAIVLVAVNPAKNFREAANTQRYANLNAILNAVGQYTIDNKGDLTVLNLPTTADDIGGNTGEVDLCVLVPKFIAALPVDPTTEQTDTDLETKDQSISEDDCGQDYATGYQVVLHNDRVTVSAPNTVDVLTGKDDAPEISVTR